MFNEIQNRVNAASGIDVSSVLNFIEEMSVANSSAYYNDERRERYIDLNIPEMIELLSSNVNNNGIRIGIIKARSNLATRFISHESNVTHF